jgi:hypothetical protein
VPYLSSAETSEARRLRWQAKAQMQELWEAKAQMQELNPVPSASVRLVVKASSKASSKASTNRCRSYTQAPSASVLVLLYHSKASKLST